MGGDASRPPIVFFDGDCALCDGFVQFLLRADRRAQLRFAPLQGSTAARLLPNQPADPQAWSVLYLDEAGLHTQSDATLRICARLGGCYRVLSWLRVVPRVLRDVVYRFVARRRYRWFGHKQECLVPNAALRARMLP